MYLEAELGAMAPTSLPAVNGAQQLDVGTAGGIMAFLQDKYLLPMPGGSGEITNWIAKPAEYLASQGYQLEGQLTASQQLQSLQPGMVAVANLDDVKSVAMGDVIQDFHVSVGPSSQASSMAAPGSNYAVLWPLSNVPGASAGGEEEQPKSMALPITLALVGGGGGALVGGPLGAIVGGIGGYMIGYAVA